MDGAHRARRAAALDAAAPGSARVRGAAHANARHVRRTGARAGARARGRTRRGAARERATSGARAQEPVDARFASPSRGCGATRRPSSRKRWTCSRRSRSASRRWREASRSSDDSPKDRAPKWTSVELVRYTARATIPPEMDVSVDVANDVPMIHGHHEALARALSNVMLNAVDACRERGGHVGVRVRRTDLGGRDSVEVAVSDTGCGIPRERLARIWDPYVTSKPGGTGLGLAIARQTVLAHHGRVDADSTVGVGTEIRFVLPVDGRRNGGGDAAVPGELIPITLFVCIGATIVGMPMARAFARRIDPSRANRRQLPRRERAARAHGAGASTASRSRSSASRKDSGSRRSFSPSGRSRSSARATHDRRVARSPCRRFPPKRCTSSTRFSSRWASSRSAFRSFVR